MRGRDGDRDDHRCTEPGQQQHGAGGPGAGPVEFGPVLAERTGKALTTTNRASTAATELNTCEV